MSSRRSKKQVQGKRRSQKGAGDTLNTQYSPGVQVVTMKISTILPKYTTTVTTGVIASSVAIQASLMTNFSTRFAAFDEFRITQVLFKANLCSASNPGTINMWVEPLSNTVPNSTMAGTNSVRRFPAGGNDRTPTLLYRPADYAYLDWLTIGTTTSPIGWLNVYTDNSTFASSTVATDYMVVSADFTVQFRGMA